MQYNLIINVKKVLGLHWWTRLETGFYHWDVWDSDLWPSFAHHSVTAGVSVVCSPLPNPQSKERVCFFFVHLCEGVYICVWMDYDWGGGACTCPSVNVCVFVPVCEWQRVLNMCWRSQRNSRALIRTSPRWQLVNSVLRKGVLYSCTKECKLVPMPSGHWEQIHMAHTLTLFWNTHWVPLWCNFLTEKQAQIIRPTRAALMCAFIHVHFPSTKFGHSWDA